MADHSATAHDDGHGHGDRHPRLQHHFQDMRTQQHAARLGMWLFLATEILLFGGLFCAYSYYRTLYPEAWKACSQHTFRLFGLFETFDLITSSFTMVMAIHMARLGKKNLATVFLLATIGMGLLFLCLHGYEYYHEYLEGALPGKYYHFEEVKANGASMYYAVYFLMTGLHSVHVMIGAGVLAVLAFFTWRGDYDASYDHPLDLGGLYWHLVDLIWIFLFPLLYLV
jgi:cytochrome c oxidase subunit III